MEDGRSKIVIFDFSNSIGYSGLVITMAANC
jgi:hypothetical protein